MMEDDGKSLHESLPPFFIYCAAALTKHFLEIVWLAFSMCSIVLPHQIHVNRMCHNKLAQSVIGLVMHMCAEHTVGTVQSLAIIAVQLGST